MGCYCEWGWGAIVSGVGCWCEWGWGAIVSGDGVLV